jgi:hypothetical protein
MAGSPCGAGSRCAPVARRDSEAKVTGLAFFVPTIPEMEQLLAQRLDSLPVAARAELLHILMLAVASWFDELSRPMTRAPRRISQAET